MRLAVMVGSTMIAQAIRPEMFDGKIGFNIFVAIIILIALTFDLAELERKPK
jgi:hypothetical protein